MGSNIKSWDRIPAFRQLPHLWERSTIDVRCSATCDCHTERDASIFFAMLPGAREALCSAFRDAPERALIAAIGTEGSIP